MDCYLSLLFANNRLLLLIGNAACCPAGSNESGGPNCEESKMSIEYYNLGVGAADFPPH